MATMLREVHTQGRDIHTLATEFLKSRRDVTVVHSGGTLLEHLSGVHAKLREWDCSEAVCLAGLFHSVYGTEHFRRRLIPLSERPAVAGVIGERAEWLTHEFCMLDTRAFVQALRSELSSEGPAEPLRAVDGLTGQDRLDLLHIFAANWLEQLPRLRPIQRAHHTALFAKARPLMVPTAAEELERTYDFEALPQQRLAVTPLMADGGAGRSIAVMDDFVPAHLRMRLTALTESNIWRYGWKAAETQTGHGFWHSHFAGDNEDKEACCEHELVGRPLVEPVLALWHLIRDSLAPDHVPVRVYANGHTYGGDGHLHTDSERPNHFTSLYYAHPDWEANWAGETVFFERGRRDVVKSVSPMPGRLVHFRGDIPHAARSPSRDCPALRAVIVIKTVRPEAG